LSVAILKMLHTTRIVCDEIYAPRFIFHTIQHATNNPDMECTPESEKSAFEWLKNTWGNWHTTIDELIAEGDRVMMRWTFYGIQQGEFRGIPPSNKPVTYSGINIFRIENGKIAEIWDLYDRLWLWQQLGVLPETTEFLAKAREAMFSQQNEKTT
jgi:predicted SnoaL-like aldol condensation-catalyzing enzyme